AAFLRSSRLVFAAVLSSLIDLSLVVRIGPADLFAQLQAVERRLPDVDTAVLDKRPEVPIEQCQKERADMRPVDVRVAQQDGAAVAQLLDVEVVTDPRAEGGDE